MKKLDTGQSDILVLADVRSPPHPPPEIEIGLNMNAIAKKSFQERSSSTFYQSNPPPSLPLLLSDSMPEQETGEFQFQMDLWTRTPSTTSLQPKK